MNYRKILLPILIITTLAMGGCKNFLEQPPFNRVSVDDIFKDFDGGRTTLVGLYDNLKSTNYYLKDFYIYPELTGGNIKYSRSSNQSLLQAYSFANDAFNNDMNGFYQIGYATIYGANNIIQYINRVADASTFQKNKMLADAYTIRALVHFDLARVFAMPYNLTPAAGHPGIIIRNVNGAVTSPTDPPNTVSEVYRQVAVDLDSALFYYQNSTNIYTGGNEKTFLSADAARALLSRVSLYSNNYAATIAAANAIISSNRYPLVPNSQYVSSWARKNISNESIFELAYGNRIGGSLGDYYNPTNTQYGQLATTTDLLNLYAPGDVRGNPALFVSGTFNNQTYFFSRKYQGMNDSANNIKILRLSEVYLNRAEAYAETDALSQALADLNTIRKRANPAAADFVSTDKAAIINEILMERRRELAFEGHAFFDLARKRKNLVRSDCTGQTCSLTYPDPRYAVPIPIQQ